MEVIEELPSPVIIITPPQGRATDLTISQFSFSELP